MKKNIIIVFIISLVYNLHAQDRQFAWSYNSPTLPKGNIDVEVWNTFSTGRKDYFYNQLQQRLEFEFGVTDNVQTSFYLNATHTGSGPKNIDDPMALIISSEFSFSNAWKFYLLNPFENTVGLSTYLEYYLLPGEIELEWKLMLDKITEYHRFVLNSTVELGLGNTFSNRNNNIYLESESEWKWKNDVGYMYHVDEHIGVGIEIRDINSFKHSNWEYSSLFVGPSIFVGGQKFFFIFNAMPQVSNLKGENKPLELNNQERFAIRVLLGVSF